MKALDVLFWWTGAVLWTAQIVAFVLFGLPWGETYRGVTILTFYGFGPVLWRVNNENRQTFCRLRECGYHFLHVRGNWFLGLSLPTWLSRRFARKWRQATANQSGEDRAAFVSPRKSEDE